MPGNREGQLNGQETSVRERAAEGMRYLQELKQALGADNKEQVLVILQALGERIEVLVSPDHPMPVSTPEWEGGRYKLGIGSGSSGRRIFLKQKEDRATGDLLPEWELSFPTHYESGELGIERRKIFLALFPESGTLDNLKQSILL